MMWAIGGVIALLVGLVGVVILVGLALPKAHTASSRILVKASPEETWKTLTDFQNHHTWRPEVTKTERRSDFDGKPAWTEHNKFGPLPMVVEEFDPPSRMVTHIIDDGMPFGGSWTYELGNSKDGTVVQITEDGMVFNPVFRFMSRFVMGYHGTMDTVLKHLARRFGEESEPEHVAQ